MAVSSLKLFIAIQKAHLKTAFQSKSDAFINIFMMIVNNLSFALMWWVLFQDKKNINGWNFDDMLILFAITCNAFWLFAVFFRGIRELPSYIEQGGIDSFLTYPRSPIFMVSTSFSTFANWGDIVTGYLAFFVSSYANFENFLLVTVFSVYAFLLLFGFGLLVSSLAFFSKNTDRLGNNLFMALLIFHHQPGSIFVGWYKVLYLTIIPAGFMSLFPVMLIKSPNWLDFLWLNIGCLGFFFGSIWVFYQGLKRYSSGNRFGIR